MTDTPNRERQIVHVERLAQGGDAVAHLSDGCVVFIPQAFPGEDVRIEVVQRKKTWAKGRVVEIIEPSPHRLDDPGCPHDDVCGGCTFRLLDYAEEFRAKVEAARDTLQRIGKFEVPGGDELAAAAPDAYRVRARLHVHKGQTGYYQGGSNAVFTLKHCPALDPRLSRIVDGLAGALRTVTKADVSIETADEEKAVVLVESEHPVADEVLDEIAGLHGVVGARLDDPDGTRVRGKPAVTTGEALGVETSVRLRPGLFRQSNAQMNPVLREQVRKRIGSGERLIELFAGSGNFTFAVADRFESIQAHEYDEAAVKYGNTIAGALGHDHVRFREIDLDVAAPEDADGATILLDPPRTGAAGAVKRLGNSDADRIVYVSCDAATLARDLRTLTGFGWTIESVDFVDMFPRTPHLEVIAVAVRK